MVVYNTAIRKRNAEFDAKVKNLYTSLLTVPFDFVCPAGEEVRELLGALTLLRGNELTKEECLKRVGNLSVALVRDLFITPKVATSVLKCIKNIPKAKKAAQGICKLFKECRATKQAANNVIGKGSAKDAARVAGKRIASKVNPLQKAILKNGYYEVNGFKFSEYYYKKLWDTGRGAPSLVAKEVLSGGAETAIPDRLKKGFYKYIHGGWEMIYNPVTKEVWHLQPMR